MRTFSGYSTIDTTHTNWRLYDLDLAKRDLLNEFYTRQGERLMSPTFGSIIWDLLFDPLTPETVDAITQDCIRIVSKDPRFNLLETNVTVSYDESTTTVSLRLFYLPAKQEVDLVANFSRTTSTSQEQE